MFHLFSGDNYYPQSGTGDYVDSFDDADEAVALGERLVELEVGRIFSHNNWWVVLDDSNGRLTEISRGYSI